MSADIRRYAIQAGFSEKPPARTITLKEACAILCCSYSTVRRLAESGELKAFRIRGAWRTSNVACEEFIERQYADQRLISQSVVVS